MLLSPLLDLLQIEAFLMLLLILMHLLPRRLLNLVGMVLHFLINNRLTKTKHWENLSHDPLKYGTIVLNCREIEFDWFI